MNTLLIVEDEKIIRQGIKSIIQRSGVPIQNIMECNNGQSALEILESQQVDVMFTDIRMPKMNGIELIEAMQKLEHKPLTVAISGYDDFTYAVRLLRMGVREYILKPVEREQIVEILTKLEEEIQERSRNCQEIKEIGCQQLKYMILNANITEKEVQAVTQRFEKQLLDKEYVVCCLENTEEEAEESKSWICLGELEGNCVYIVEKENKEFLLKNELRDSYVGVSRLHLGVAELRSAYREAKTARIEAFLRGGHEMEYREEMSEERGNVEAEKMHQIAQMIGTDKISEALKLVEEYFGEVKRGKYSGNILEQNIRILLDEILHIYRNVLQEEKGLSGFGNIYGFARLEELMEELTGWMIGFHEKLDSEFDDYKNKSRMEEALAYIRDNYDRDLNMAVVSNHVSMNYSLFSYAFKQYTGKNFVNYLKELRMNEAKRLLAETDMRVIEISRQVGYENEKHFMKTFKKECGVSPTEYRKNMQFR